MTTRCITAFEHQAIRVGDGAAGVLSEAEANALCRIGELRRGFCRRGVGVVELSQYCGVIGLGHRALEVLPKVDLGDRPELCRGILLRLLRLAEDVAVFRHVAVGQHLRSAPLLEVFIAAFLESVTELVRGGLLSQYEEREDDVGVLRGRIVFSRQLGALMNRKDRIACRYDELTPDNVWNRAVKLGLLAVRPWITRDELARRWAVAACAFEDVRVQHHPPVDLSRLVFGRQALRYRPAIEWVRWILAVLSPSFRAGDSPAPALLFDMNQVFESAVASVIRRRMSNAGGVVLTRQDRSRHLAVVDDAHGALRVPLRPDLVLRNNGSVIGIADTKWKRVDVDTDGAPTPDAADVYQLHAYGSAYGCEDLALIYPWHDGVRRGARVALRLPGSPSFRPRLTILCVDVHRDPLGLAVAGEMSKFSDLLGVEHQCSPDPSPA